MTGWLHCILSFTYKINSLVVKSDWVSFKNSCYMQISDCINAASFYLIASCNGYHYICGVLMSFIIFLLQKALNCTLELFYYGVCFHVASYNMKQNVVKFATHNHEWLILHIKSLPLKMQTSFIMQNHPSCVCVCVCVKGDRVTFFFVSLISSLCLYSNIDAVCFQPLPHLSE